MVEDIGAADMGAAPASAGRNNAKLAIAALLLAALTFVMMRAQLLAVWRTGVFFDTDDTMHLVQVRALLAGQNWFDMTVPRLDPPAGTFMHWSRLVDVPVAAMMKLFGLANDPATAERLSRLAVPFALLVALYVAMARLADALLGPEARFPAMAATLLSGGGVIEFLPGRIDHHGPQIVILVLMLTAAAGALDPLRARNACWAGGLAGLSLAINLENLPFIVAIAGSFVALWIWQGEPLRRALGWCAAGAAAGLPVCFAATVGPSRYLAPVCDAYGAAHLGAGLIGALGCACAAMAGSRLLHSWHRVALALATAGAAALFIGVAYPTCLRSPFAAVDPLVREVWLSRVQESLPLTTLFRTDPAAALFSAVPVTLGLLGCVVAACFGPTLQRTRFALVATVVASGLVLSFWQVRVFSSVTAIALCGGLYAAVAARRFFERTGREALARLSIALLFPFTATALGLALPADAATVAGTPSPSHVATLAECLAPDAFAPLATLEGDAIAPVDVGSYLLVHTRLGVFAAAFHRDNDGNHFALATMLASATEARGMIASRHVAYILICDGLSETHTLAQRTPNGLAADLLAGRIPDWLAPLDLAHTPYRVFKVQAGPI